MKGREDRKYHLRRKREYLFLFQQAIRRNTSLKKKWRPISLLNAVYKIGSAIIANRIKYVLPYLINEDQTGFMPNRFIGGNTRPIYDLIS